LSKGIVGPSFGLRWRTDEKLRPRGLSRCGPNGSAALQQILLGDQRAELVDVGDKG